VISVCVPVYRAHGPPNVASLGAALPAALDGEDGELVVALNGISASAAGAPSSARTVDLGANRGVAPGWNAAAEAAAGDILVFANDDVELGERSLATLAGALRSRRDAGVVGPVGATWDASRGVQREQVGAHGLRPGELRACDVLSGFLFAVRRETWAAAGGFDEAYAPASFEEIDFCYAVRRLGFGSYVVGGIDVAHRWGVSSRQPPWRRIAWDGRRELLWSIHRRNRRRFVEKWGDG
jgi:GT2 family glycosyltransferase